MALSRSLMHEIRPPRVFASRRTGRASPNTLALTALILASACLLVFGIFSLPVSSPIVPTTDAETELSGGREAASESSRPAHNRGRRNVRMVAEVSPSYHPCLLGDYVASVFMMLTAWLKEGISLK
ncbi:putative prolyl 4-hydroxylase 3 [Hordeum vulgare]|nr:putative prolyl 4-hydroxylase 3 [Hordeum vulgare]